MYQSRIKCIPFFLTWLLAVIAISAGAQEKAEKIDVSADDEVTKIDDEGKSSESGTEELDVTDLVKSSEKIETKQDQYFDQLFGYLKNLETKLSEMDGLVEKLNSIETKIEKYREKTPQEKLHLRSLDSGPYTQKLTDFFDDNKDKFEKQGKHEYVLTSDEVENVNPSEIKKTFTPNGDDDTDFNF
jgi:flagellar motility protein MotE (MotC chaperone)